jgi:hypothetical protein
MAEAYVEMEGKGRIFAGTRKIKIRIKIKRTNKGMRTRDWTKRRF